MKTAKRVLGILALLSLTLLSSCTPDPADQKILYDLSIEGLVFEINSFSLSSELEEPYRPVVMILENGFDRNGKAQVWCKTYQASIDRTSDRFYVDEKHKHLSSNPYISVGSVAINGNLLEFKSMTRNFTNGMINETWKIVNLGNYNYRLESTVKKGYFLDITYSGYNTPGPVIDKLTGKPYSGGSD